MTALAYYATLALLLAGTIWVSLPRNQEWWDR